MIRRNNGHERFTKPFFTKLTIRIVRRIHNFFLFKLFSELKKTSTLCQKKSNGNYYSECTVPLAVIFSVQYSWKLNIKRLSINILNLNLKLHYTFFLKALVQGIFKIFFVQSPRKLNKKQNVLLIS